MLSKNYKILEYTFVGLGIFVFGFLYFNFRGDARSQIVVTALASLFYVIWGIAHHHMEARLTWAVALEYVLIALFVFFLALTALSV